MRTGVLMFIAAVGLVACVTVKPPTTVPLALVHNRPVLLADINGRTVRLILDLGYDAPVGLARGTLDRIGIVPRGPARPVWDLKGHLLEAPTFKVQRLRIGSAVFTNVEARVDVDDPSAPSARFGQDGFIGPSLFFGYRIVLNYRDGEMTMIPPGNSTIEPAGCIPAGTPFLRAVSKVQTDFGNLTLVLDTGTPVSFVGSARIDQPGTQARNHAVQTQLSRIGYVDFGPLELVPLDLSLPHGADGILGGNFFDQHVVCFEFRPRSPPGAYDEFEPPSTRGLLGLQ